jgi:hypothetical protein
MDDDSKSLREALVKAAVEAVKKEVEHNARVEARFEALSHAGWPDDVVKQMQALSAIAVHVNDLLCRTEVGDALILGDREVAEMVVALANVAIKAARLSQKAAPITASVCPDDDSPTAEVIIESAELAIEEYAARRTLAQCVLGQNMSLQFDDLIALKADVDRRRRELEAKHQSIVAFRKATCNNATKN